MSGFEPHCACGLLFILERNVPSRPASGNDAMNSGAKRLRHAALKILAICSTEMCVLRDRPNRCRCPSPADRSRVRRPNQPGLCAFFQRGRSAKRSAPMVSNRWRAMRLLLNLLVSLMISARLRESKVENALASAGLGSTRSLPVNSPPIPAQLHEGAVRIAGGFSSTG